MVEVHETTVVENNLRVQFLEFHALTEFATKAGHL